MNNFKLYNLLNKSGKETIDEHENSIAPWICAEEHLLGFEKKIFSHTDGDGNVYRIIFKKGQKFYETEVIEYDMASFTSWGEELLFDKEHKITCFEVVKKIVKTESWEKKV